MRISSLMNLASTIKSDSYARISKQKAFTVVSPMSSPTYSEKKSVLVSCVLRKSLMVKSSDTMAICAIGTTSPLSRLGMSSLRNFNQCDLKHPIQNALFQGIFSFKKNLPNPSFIRRAFVWSSNPFIRMAFQCPPKKGEKGGSFCSIMPFHQREFSIVTFYHHLLKELSDINQISLAFLYKCYII